MYVEIQSQYIYDKLDCQYIRLRVKLYVEIDDMYVY
jgi:hypothetical protein